MTTYRDRLIAGIHTTPDPDKPLTKDELQAALKVLGEPTTGNKAELEERLATAQQEA